MVKYACPYIQNKCWESLKECYSSCDIKILLPKAITLVVQGASLPRNQTSGIGFLKIPDCRSSRESRVPDWTISQAYFCDLSLMLHRASIPNTQDCDRKGKYLVANSIKHAVPRTRSHQPFSYADASFKLQLANTRVVNGRL